MVDIWKRVFPSLYQTPNFSKIDPEKEGILDFCPICQEQLPDKKIITYKRHEWEKHRESDKVISKRIRNNTIGFIPVIGMLGFLAFILLDGVGLHIYDASMESQWLPIDDCELLNAEIKARLYEDGVIMSDVQDKMNTLFNECNVSMSVYDPERTMMTLEIMEFIAGEDLRHSEPLTKDEKRYEKILESIDEIKEKQQQLEP